LEVVRHWVSVLAVVGNQPRGDVYAMELHELVWWVGHVAETYLFLKGIDPFT